MKTLTIWNSGNHSFAEALQDHALYSCILSDNATDEDIKKIIDTVNDCNGNKDAQFLVSAMPTRNDKGIRLFQSQEQAYKAYLTVYGDHGADNLRIDLSEGLIVIK